MTLRVDSRKGISTYIAVLILIVLAIAAGLLIYLYTMGYIGNISNMQTSGKALQIQSVSQNASSIWVYVKNIGSSSVTLDPNGVYVNSIKEALQAERGQSS